MSRFVDNTLLKGGWVNGNNLQKGGEKGKNILGEGSPSIFSQRKNRYLCWSGKAFSGIFYNFAGEKACSVKLADSLRAFIILSKHYLNTFKGHSRSILSVMNYTLYIGVYSCLFYSKSKTYRGTLY